MRIRELVVVMLMLGVAACGGSSTSPSSTGSSGNSSSSGSGSSGGTGGGGSSPNGSVTFKVDGVQNSASLVTATYSGGILSIGATDTSRQTTLGFAISGSSLGTYTMGVTSPTNALLQIGSPAQGWQAGVGFGSGSVTLTAFSPTNATGTFSFTMVPLTATGATANRAVTEGTFNVIIR